MDRLGSHIDPKFSKIFHKYHIHPYLLPSSTTHFLQPLDDNYFLNFKKNLSTGTSKKISENPMLNETSDESEALLAAVIPALKAASTTEIITASFRNTGIFPWDPELILSRANTADPTQKIKDKNLPSRAKEIISLLSETQATTPPATISPVKLHQKQLKETFEYYDVTSLQQERLDEKRKIEEKKEKKRQEAQKTKEQKQLELQQKKKERKELMETRKRKKEQEEDDKAKKRRIESCYVCEKRWGGSTKWLWCEHCDYFGLCTRCLADPELRQQLEAHGDDCNFVGLSWDQLKLLEQKSDSENESED